MSDATPAPSNRRRCRRLKPKSSTKASCFRGVMGLGKNLAVTLLDLSEEGVRLLLKEPLPVGQEVEVHLDSLQHRRPLKVSGQVVWSVPAADGSCCVGVQFSKSVRYADVTSLARY